MLFIVLRYVRTLYNMALCWIICWQEFEWCAAAIVFLRRIGREDKLLSSYYRVMQCRKYFGKRGYYKALWIFVCNEHRNMVYATFRGILMNNVKNICEKLTSW